MTRDELISAYLPLALRITRTVFHKNGFQWSQFEDALQDAHEGLIKAVDSYDPTKGPMEPYLWLRIRGEVMDGIRRRAGVRNENGRLVRRCPETLSLDHDAEGGHLAGTVADPSDDMATVDDRLTLQTALDAIPRSDQALLMEHYCYRKPILTMAKEHGVGWAAMDKRLKEALSRAQRVLGIPAWHLTKTRKLPKP